MMSAAWAGQGRALACKATRIAGAEILMGLNRAELQIDLQGSIDV
jgi:hypothetical protein